MMTNDEEIYKERDPDTSEPVFYLLFASQLILMLMGMFISVKMGLSTLPIVTVLGVIALGRCSSRSTDWKRGRNLMAGLILIWGLYCLFEIGNSNHVQEAWNIAIPQYFFYPLLCAFLVPLTIRNYKGIERLLAKKSRLQRTGTLFSLCTGRAPHPLHLVRHPLFLLLFRCG